MKLSARNKLPVKVEKVEKSPVVCKVFLRVEDSAIVTAVIRRKALDELNLVEGDRVEAVVKATEVMLLDEE